MDKAGLHATYEDSRCVVSSYHFLVWHGRCQSDGVDWTSEVNMLYNRPTIAGQGPASSTAGGTAPAIVTE